MDYNAEQLAAIESQARHTLVLAGAGTGKTRTIIGRVERLIREGVDPARVLVLTFTRRAANELRQRMTSQQPGSASRVVAGTFHHLCLRLMSARRKWFGFEDLTVMDRDDQLQLMKLVRGKLVGKNAAIPQAAKLLDYYSFARNTNQSAKRYLEKYSEFDEPDAERILEIFASYKERKQAGGYVDYDDILHRFAKVLHDNRDVRAKVAGQFDHVLVDEMQDTNPLQWLILDQFAERCSLFCVGDDAQSIYAFRGADFENVHSFHQRLPNSRVLKLQENYRSTQPILDLANWLLDASPLEYGKQLVAHRSGGTRPTLLDFNSEFEEADWIVDAIKKNRIEGDRWSDHMILCRTAYSARPIEGQLIEQKVPYRFVGGVGLLQMAHVRDLLACLRLTLNHRDELAWMRYLTLWPGIGEVTASRGLADVASAETLEQGLVKLRTRFQSRKDVVELLDRVHAINEPVAAIKETRKGLESVLERRYDRWDSRRKDFDLLENLAANHRSLRAFLETYTLDPVSSTETSPQAQQDEGVVTLITVHSAKGTECKHCYVAAVQPGNYPHSRSLDDEAAIEEERRVLYVALTRAEDELVLTRSLSRGYSRVSWNLTQGSHYFLEQLPSDLLEWDYRLQSKTEYLLDDDVIG